jgi:Tol biopolymer transport system component
MKRLMLIVALAAAALAVGAQSGNDLFQKALVMERTEGNLQEAIKLYQQIVDKFSADRKLAAQALLQMGRCYETLGQAGARKAYERIVSEYADQVEAVRQAEENLSRLYKAETPVEKGNEFKLKKIYTGEDYVDSISPDGEKLALIRDDEIWVKDIETGREDNLTTDQNTNWGTLWSPDSQWIVFVDSDGNIKAVSARGGSSRTLVSIGGAEDKKGMTPTSWSPDGSRIMFHVPSMGLYAVPFTGGEWEEILAFPNPQEAKKYESMVLSPNGRWIAYAAEVNGNTDIYVMPFGGGDAVRVTSNPAADRRPIWSYDDKRLAFAAYGYGNPQIWSVEISSEGKPEGLPVQVTRENHILGGNWTRKGNLGFPAAFRIQHIFIANADGSEEVQLTRFPSFNGTPQWSPDGEKILFLTDYLQSLNNLRFWTVSSKGGEPKPAQGERVGIRTSDGKRTLFVRRGPSDSKIMMVDAEGGDPEEIASIHGVVRAPLYLSPDGSSVLFTYDIRPSESKDGMDYMKKRLSGIGVIPMSGGEPRIIIGNDKEGFWYPCARWSPDGRKIAFVLFEYEKLRQQGGACSIWIMDADGLHPRLLANGGQQNLCWSPDGNEIIYETQIGGPNSMQFELYKIGAEGGQPVRMNIQGRSAEFSPDGKRLAYQRWIGGGYEFWLAENILK